MLWRGVLECVARHCRLPLCIMARGAVAKATAPFYRLITDCRPVNEFADPWRVKYISMAGLSLLLSPGCFFWVINLHSAHHATPLGGCGRPYITITRWIRSQRTGTAWEPLVTRVYGCTPETCSGCCDKSCMGIMLNGHCFRFASCQFGHKTSNGPLAVLTDAILNYLSRLRNLDGSCYVDDFILCITTSITANVSALTEGVPNARAMLPRPRSSRRSRTRCWTICTCDTTKRDTLMLSVKST